MLLFIIFYICFLFSPSSASINIYAREFFIVFIDIARQINACEFSQIFLLVFKKLIASKIYGVNSSLRVSAKI